MEHDSRAYLHDIKHSCEEIKEFTKNISLKKYCANTVVKAAVERKFLIVGEAMARLRKEYPEIYKKFIDADKIIGFRNILVHGYDIIDDATVWSAVKENMPKLLLEVKHLLKNNEAS